MVPLERWEEMLTMINCSVLSYMRNEYCDAYLLSESSLFVYSHKVLIKTCGKITLLRCLDYLIGLGKEFCGSSVIFFTYSRRNFLFPDEQLPPHTSWQEESSYLREHFPEGEALVFGPRSCDHHFTFVYESTKKVDPIGTGSTTLEVLMTGLDRSVMDMFYQKEDFISSREVTTHTGIADLLPGVKLDDHQFDPLGYSLNGLYDEDYFTIHITPQPECSFVSFETNSVQNYQQTVQNVVNLFKPDTFTVLLASETICTMEVLGPVDGFYLRNAKYHSSSNNPSRNINFSSYRRYETPAPPRAKTGVRKSNSNREPVIVFS